MPGGSGLHRFLASLRSASISTSTGAVTAPGGTVAVIWVSESIEYVVAGTVPKSTEVAFEKPAPVIVTVAPTGPFAGLSERRTGCARDHGADTTTIKAASATTATVRRRGRPPTTEGMLGEHCPSRQPLLRGPPAG
jgi:hypothetical protein